MKKFGVVKGNVAEATSNNNVEEVETTMEEMNAQTQDVTAPATEQATEKVGFFTKVKTGIKSTGKKIWNNRGKIGVAVGAIGTIAGAIAIDRARHSSDNSDELQYNELESIPEYIPEESETTENIE